MAEEQIKFAVCVDNADYPASLEIHKVYRLLPDKAAESEGEWQILDESGEDYLYPAEKFVRVDLPYAVEKSFLPRA